MAPRRRTTTWAVATALLAAWVLAPRAQQAPSGSSYVVGVHDVLTIAVFGEQEMSKQYTVDSDGMISVKWIGRTRAAGLTVSQLETSLKAKLSPDYLVNPQISISVQDYKSKQVFVSGEVRTPGPVPLTGGMRLLQALVSAGGPLASAEGDVVVSHGRKSGEPPAPPPQGQEADGLGPSGDLVRIDLVKLQLGDPDLNIELQDGDSVYVPRADTVFVFGEVKNPGGYPAPKGTNVLQALAMAGGVTPDGDKNKVEITRTVNGKSTVVKKVKLTDFVQPGDVVVVKAHIF